MEGTLDIRESCQRVIYTILIESIKKVLCQRCFPVNCRRFRSLIEVASISESQFDGSFEICSNKGLDLPRILLEADIRKF